MNRLWPPRYGMFLSRLLMCLVFLTGCLGNIPGEGVSDSGSVLKVEAINGFYNAKSNSIIQVDVIQDACQSGQGGATTPEFFSDHYAEAMISNSPLPNSTTQTASEVYIHSYSIVYQPVSAGIPALVPYVDVPIKDTYAIPPCTPGTTCDAVTSPGLKFMDLAKKSEYLDGLCGERPSLADCPLTPPQDDDGCYWLLVQGACVRVSNPLTLKEATYIVHYTFSGENIYGKEVSCQGSHHFTVDDYDYCQTSGG